MRMMWVGCGALAAVLAAAAAPAAAQDAKAAEILAKTRQALGGRKVENLKTLSLEAALQRNVGNMQIASDVELHLEMPDRFVRSETSSRAMGMTMTSGFNGDRAISPSLPGMAGGMVIRMGPGGPPPGEPEKLTPEQQEEMNRVQVRAQRTELSRLMLGWFGMAHPSLKAEYTYAGEAESPDGKAHVIDVKNGDGFEARLFVDQNNYLPLMVTYQGRQPQMMTSVVGGPRGGGSGAAPAARPAQTEGRELSEEERRKMRQDAEERLRQMSEAPTVQFSLFFDDWREVDGLTFPHVVRRAAAGTTNEEWTIKKVKLNPKLDARKFAVDTK